MSTLDPIASTLLSRLFNEAQDNPAGHCDDCSNQRCYSEPYEFWGERGHRDTWECAAEEESQCPYVRAVLEAALAKIDEKGKAP